MMSQINQLCFQLRTVRSEICEFMAVQVPKIRLGLLKKKIMFLSSPRASSGKYKICACEVCVADGREKGGLGWWEGKQEEENDGKDD